jgi:hypothetical protein
MVVLYRIQQDAEYKSLDIASSDEEDYYAHLSHDGIDFEQATRGHRLGKLWNPSWRFVFYEESRGARKKGAGDIALMSGRLIGALNASVAAVLRELLGNCAEELHAHLDASEISLFNVTRKVDRVDLWKLESDAVFRINPTCLDVLCGEGFKEKFVRHNFVGLKLRAVDPDGAVPMV